MDQNINKKEADRKGGYAGGRILWVDGLRGIGCICIFLHHFFLKYYPATYTGLLQDSRIRGAWDAKLASLPFFFLMNGNFWVCVYLLISGMVMAGKRTEAEPPYRVRYFFRSFMKRYLTLVLPVLISELLVFCGNRRFPEQIIPAAGETLPLAQYLKSSFFSVFFLCDRSIIGSLWTMQPIFLGGLLILAIRLLMRNETVQILLLSGCVILFLRFEYWWYFVPVLIGGICGILGVQRSENRHWPVTFFCFLFGFFLAAYPSGMIPTGVYGRLPDGVHSVMGYHLLGAAFCMVGISSSRESKKLLSGKICQFLGKISYPFYVFHETAIKASNVTRPVLEKYISSYSLLILLTGCITLCLVFTAAIAYDRLLAPRWRRIVGHLERKI
ncbi:MAG: acyltransferase [Lachnospiraceae bacterium]|nr:acyltransferase [Lachnospiraceae bacterium]